MAPVLQTLVGSRLNGRRTQEDGPGHPAASAVPAQIGRLFVDTGGQGVGPVDVPLDHRRPVVGKVTIEFRLDRQIIQQDIGWHYQGAAVSVIPEAVNDGGHKAQHAAGSLEVLQRRPVGIEPLENLRVYWVSGLDAVFVGRLSALGWEFLTIGSVKVAIGPGDVIPLYEGGLVGDGLETGDAGQFRNSLQQWPDAHDESIRPITFLRLAMACRPRSPPTSTSAVASSASEAGRLMISRQLFANLADSDNA